ncbi:hypothetical protein SPILM97S_06758 [Streptomyces pilosus]
MAWSGLTVCDLSKPRQRMGLYRTIVHEGLREDLSRYLSRDPWSGPTTSRPACSKSRRSGH